MDCAIDRMMLKSMAVQKESTLKPPTICVQRRMISALMTSKNKPSVRMVTGRVKSTMIGFMKMLSNPSTIATMTDVKKLSTCTPPMNREITMTSTAVTNILNNRFIKKRVKI